LIEVNLAAAVVQAAGLEPARSLLQFAFAPGPVFDDFPSMLVLHLFPAFAFVARARAAEAKAGFVVELADIDTG
jgi:hypothetical protein